MKISSAIFILPVWLSKIVICEPSEKAAKSNYDLSPNFSSNATNRMDNSREANFLSAQTNQMDNSREANLFSVQTSGRTLLFQAVHPRNEINNANGLFRAKKKDKRSKTQRNVRSSSLNSTDFGDQQWKCFSDIQRLLENRTGNPWTLQFLDSWAKPGPSLLLRHWNMVGNYKQCRSARAPPLPDKEGTGFSGNYCLLNLTPKEYKIWPAIMIGVCMPDSCTELDITQFVEHGLVNMSSGLTALPTECRTDERETTGATLLAIFLFTIIVVLVFCGTLFDLVIGRWQKQKWVSTLQGVLGQTLLAFSVLLNGSKILDTSQPPGSLTAINGIRFITLTWVLLGHNYGFGSSSASNAVSEVVIHYKTWTADVIFNGTLAVDTFFTLSGLLVAYVTTKEMAMKGAKFNLGLFYLHRYWRLTPPYMLVLVGMLGLQRFMGSGALWATVQPSVQKYCEENWWTNLLYLNNVVNADRTCFGHFWYLAADMQYYLFSPLILIPFVHHISAGMISCGFFLSLQWISTFALSYHNQWSPALFGLGIKVKPGSLDYNVSYYVAPHCRMGPYLVGLLAGYLLATCNGRLRLHKFNVFLCWLLSVMAALSIVYGIHGDISGENISSVGVAALYNAFARTAWSTCVSWVIIACSSGYGGPVNALLSWSPFVPLSRLTYMAYLVHPCVFSAYYGNQETLYNLNFVTFTVSYLGLLCFTYMISFVLVLGLESPWITLEKVFLKKTKNT